MTGKVCQVDGCTTLAKARGWCNRHYLRWWSHGDPIAPTLPLGPSKGIRDEYGIPLAAWDDVLKDETGCWLWQRQLTRGYGRIWIDGENIGVHVYFYRCLAGDIPEGLVLDHLCRVRNCVNPEHLEPVPNGENVLRGEGLSAQNARKTHCNHGHEFSPANTGRDKRGDRVCLTCKRENLRRWRAKKRGSRAEI